MYKTALLMLILILTLEGTAAATTAPSLEGLGLEALLAVQQEADARIRSLRFPDPQGYLDVGDGEGYARQPDAHLRENIRLDGEVLALKAEGSGFEAYVSLLTNPGIVFAVRYTLQAGEALILAGDQVSVFGRYQGLLPFDASGSLADGAPLVQAELITSYQEPVKPKAAAPYAGTREDPAPLNITAHYEGSYWSDYSSYDLTMTQSLRGNEAQKKAKSFNSYNISAPKGMEYFLVYLQVKATATPDGRAEIDNRDFYFVSASGKEYRQHFLISDQQTLGNLYIGNDHMVIISCLIEKGDKPLIVFKPDSTSPLWFDPNPR